MRRYILNRVENEPTKQDIVADVVVHVELIFWVICINSPYTKRNLILFNLQNVQSHQPEK
jgi:hypothetical protein